VVNGPAAEELLQQEVKKVNDEITRNEEAENSCFHYKLLMLGAMFGALVLSMSRKQSEGAETASTPGIDASFLLGNSRVLFAVALAFAVSILIDGRVRNLENSTVHLAQWIVDYAEPALLQNGPEPKSGEFMGFEQWMHRRPNPDGKVQITEGESPSQGRSGQHENTLYQVLQWLPVQSVSYVLYVLFVYLLLAAGKIEDGLTRTNATWAYTLVHVALLAFWASAHFAPWTEASDLGGIIRVGLPLVPIVVTASVVAGVVFVRDKVHDSSRPSSQASS
jgi:hypothetical protein